MKKIYICLLFSLASAGAFCQETFNGNGKTDFGGAVGQGSLEITNDASTYYFKFTKGTGGNFNDALVLYVDSKTGGFSSTAGFLDNGDGLRRATSGYNIPTEKSVLTFPAGFLPDYAIAFDQGFAAIFELVNGGTNSFNYVGSGSLTPTGNTAPVFNFTVTRAQLGISSGFTFNFLGAYIATSAFRSNEYIGEAGPASNSGLTDYTATTFVTYFGGVLPLQFSNFALRKSAGNAVQLSWKTSLEQNVSHFDILRSSDGLLYTAISALPARNTATENLYSFTDISPAKANNYYKILMVDKDGRKKVSEILKINLSSKAAEILAYQSGNTIRVNLSNLDKGNYTVRLSNAQGQQVHAGTIIHNGGNTAHTLNIKTVLLPSVYHLTLINNSERLNTSFIVQ